LLGGPVVTEQTAYSANASSCRTERHHSEFLLKRVTVSNGGINLLATGSGINRDVIVVGWVSERANDCSRELVDMIRNSGRQVGRSFDKIVFFSSIFTEQELLRFKFEFGLPRR